MVPDMERHYTRVYYYSALNSFCWLLALTFFTVMFISFFFRWNGPIIYIFPSIMGASFLFLCLVASCATCSLPAYRVFYIPTTSVRTTTNEDYEDTKDESSPQNL